MGTVVGVQTLARIAQEIDNVDCENEDLERRRAMTKEETEIYAFLKRFPNQFVSVNDVSKSVGSRKLFNEDRNWSLPILRRMAVEGLIEMSAFGEFRVPHQPDETTTFKKALETPGAALGDTAIICMDDVQGQNSKVA